MDEYDRYGNDSNIEEYGQIDEAVDAKKNDETQLSRKEKLNSMCQLHANMVSNKTTMRGIFFVNRAFYYCNVPKLGSSFLKAFLAKGLRTTGTEVQGYEHYLSKHIFSFLNVGDPYGRLFSAYKDKLFKPDPQFWHRIGVDVVKTIRNNHTTNDTGFDVTFEEFIRYVVVYHEQGKELNAHIEPVHKQCNPCATRFDFVGRMETMSDDLIDMFATLKNSEYIEDEISVSLLEQTIRNNASHSSGSIKRLFVAINTYPEISAYNLFLRHWSIYHIGGYILNQYDLPFSKSNIGDVTEEMYYTAVKDAIDESKDNKEQLSLQRREAFVQAYRGIPVNLMNRLINFVKTDCLLFSYDVKPALLFDERNPVADKITHKYMKGI